MAVSEKTYNLSRIDTEEYESLPEEGVLEGKPNTRIHWLRNTPAGDGILLTGVMRADPSKMEYTFPGDETFHLIKGELEIELENGDVVKMGPGDIASFPKGMKSVWTIKSMMEKFVVVSG